MDKWHGGICSLRQFLKGLGNNLRGEYKRRKAELLTQIQTIDDLLETRASDEDLTKKRFQLEGELEKLLEAEEMYWQ